MFVLVEFLYVISKVRDYPTTILPHSLPSVYQIIYYPTSVAIHRHFKGTTLLVGYKGSKIKSLERVGF